MAMLVYQWVMGDLPYQPGDFWLPSTTYGKPAFLVTRFDPHQGRKGKVIKWAPPQKMVGNSSWNAKPYGEFEEFDLKCKIYGEFWWILRNFTLYHCFVWVNLEKSPHFSLSFEGPPLEWNRQPPLSYKDLWFPNWWRVRTPNTPMGKAVETKSSRQKPRAETKGAGVGSGLWQLGGANGKIGPFY